MSFWWLRSKSKKSNEELSHKGFWVVEAQLLSHRAAAKGGKMKSNETLVCISCKVKASNAAIRECLVTCTEIWRVVSKEFAGRARTVHVVFSRQVTVKVVSSSTGSLRGHQRFLAKDDDIAKALRGHPLIVTLNQRQLSCSERRKVEEHWKLWFVLAAKQKYAKQQSVDV